MATNDDHTFFLCVLIILRDVPPYRKPPFFITQCPIITPKTQQHGNSHTLKAV